MVRVLKGNRGIVVGLMVQFHNVRSDILLRNAQAAHRAPSNISSFSIIVYHLYIFMIGSIPVMRYHTAPLVSCIA